MKVAVVGCGAVGSFYGAKLARAGHEVHFLLRSDYAVVRRKGVSIRSLDGDFCIRPKCARLPREIGPSDWVLIALKTTANDQYAKLLPPLVGPQTAVTTLQNGLGNEEQLARLFPASQVLGGLCFVCLNRTQPGVIRHLDHGQIILGEYLGWPEPRTHELASAFRNAGVHCTVTDNLARTHWEKLVWNIPFNGLGIAALAGLEAFRSSHPEDFKFAQEVKPGAGRSVPTDELLASPEWAEFVRKLMLEVIHAARGLGFNLPDALAYKQIERTRSMGAYKASTLIDFERSQPLELESLFLEPCRQAVQVGVSVPILQRLCAILSRLDPGRKEDQPLNSLSVGKKRES